MKNLHDYFPTKTTIHDAQPSVHPHSSKEMASSRGHYPRGKGIKDLFVQSDVLFQVHVPLQVIPAVTFHRLTGSILLEVENCRPYARDVPGFDNDTALSSCMTSAVSLSSATMAPTGLLHSILMERSAKTPPVYYPFNIPRLSVCWKISVNSSQLSDLTKSLARFPSGPISPVSMSSSALSRTASDDSA